MEESRKRSHRPPQGHQGRQVRRRDRGRGGCDQDRPQPGRGVPSGLMRRLVVLLTLIQPARSRRRLWRPRRTTSSPRCGHASPRPGGLVDQAVAAAARATARGERARPHRLSRPLRARGGAAAPARPEPRARPRVQLRRVPQRDPRRRADVRDQVERGRDPRRPGSTSTGRSQTRASRRRLLAFGVRVRDPVPRGGRGRAPALADPAPRAFSCGQGQRLPEAARWPVLSRRSARRR